MWSWSPGSATTVFVRQGVPAEKLLLLPLGVDTQAFRISEEMLEWRYQRILSGSPLTVLTAAQVNFRIGLYDFAKIAAACDGRIRFRWIGLMTIAELPPCVEMVPHQPLAALPRAYAEADLFLLPTIEDGYPLVLAVARANSLPLLTTTNCSEPRDHPGRQTGWVPPIRSLKKFIERLLWCDAHRQELAYMIRAMTARFPPREWSDVAADFESLCASTRAA
jgi:glycosyltransferase involved in cell wall biosynthesis